LQGADKVICINTKKLSLIFLACVGLSIQGNAKVKQIGNTILLRPVNIKNVAYASNGKSIAIPNFITAGSVAIFFVSEQGEIGSIPSRFALRDFVHTAGVFYYYSRKEQLPSMAFLPLQELLSGYSVSYSPSGDTLAVAGNDKILLFDSETRRQIKSVTIGSNTTRAVFSPDGKLLGAIAGGKLFMLETRNYSLLYTISAEKDHQLADIAFSSDGERFAVYEFQTITLDHTSRISIYESSTGNHDRNLPYFAEKISSTPGSHLPLLSYSPKDSAIAVTLEKPVGGKIVLIKSNDGALIKEFKGYCHAFSPDGSLLSAGGQVYSTSDWTVLGKHSKSALCAAFSPTERVLLVVTPENIKRYRIE
jgi:WD40 repeat protein